MYKQMLQAQLADGTLVILATLMKKEIEHFRKNEKFYCPSCKERVIIKAGRKVIPHFAHVSLQDCLANTKGEGPEHEHGKLLLYQWLKSQGMHVELEKYLQEINQRPDLFVTIQNKRIAIEYQCARVSIEQIQKRNKGYKQAGITPIWILGTKLFNRTSTYGIKIEEFTKQFIHQFSSNCIPTIYFFCPQTKQFAFFQDMYFKSKFQTIGKLQFHSLSKVNLKNFFQYKRISKKRLYTLWFHAKKSFRLRRQRQAYGREKRWIEWLYNHRTHREFLPSIVYLPVANQFQMKSSLWDWQSRLCIDLIDKLSLGSRFTIDHCEHLLRSHLQDKNVFPLVHPTETAIHEYLQILTELHIIKQITSTEFTKINSLTFHKNIEDALNSDKILMNAMIRNIETNIEHNEGNIRYTQ